MWVTKNGQQQEIEDGTLPYWRSLGWVEWRPDVGTEAIVASAWAANTAYLAGQLVWQAGQLYRAKADFTSGGSFVAGNWDAVGSAASGVAWQTAITTNTTATKGNGYPADCTAGAVSLTLPASPALGDQVGFYKTDATTNALTVVGTINGQTNATVTTQNAGATVIYQGGTIGWLADLYGGVSAVTTVQDEGTPLTARPIIDFIGAGVTAADDAANNRTTVTIPGGSGSGGLLGFTEYFPGTFVSYNLTSTTLADIDATNLAVTFTPPASGAVLVRLTGQIAAPTSTFPNWGLRNGTTQMGNTYNVSQSGSTITTSVSFHITGLTPGTPVTFKWAYKVNSGTATQSAGGTTNGNAAIMEVWSA